MDIVFSFLLRFIVLGFFLGDDLIFENIVDRSLGGVGIDVYIEDKGGCLFYLDRKIIVGI